MTNDTALYIEAFFNYTDDNGVGYITTEEAVEIMSVDLHDVCDNIDEKIVKGQQYMIKNFVPEDFSENDKITLSMLYNYFKNKK